MRWFSRAWGPWMSVLAVCLVNVPGHAMARSSDKAGALVLVVPRDNRAKLGKPASHALAVALEELSELYELSSVRKATRLPVVEAQCTPAKARTKLERKAIALRQGQDIFYSTAESNRAIAVLDPAVHEILSEPCLLALTTHLRDEVLSAGVLLARLHHARGQFEKVVEVLRLLLSAFEPRQLTRQDLPPESAEFVRGAVARLVQEHVSLKVRVDWAPRTEPPKRVKFFVDGRPLTAEGVVDVLPGRHRIFMLSGKDGRVMALDVAVKGSDRAVDFHAGVVGMLAPMDGLPATRYVGPPGLVKDVARHLRAITGLPVALVVEELSGASWEVSLLSGQREPHTGSSHLYLRVSPLAGSEGLVKVSVDPNGPLVRRSPWYWPWVSLSLGAAALAAGVTLNVYSNRISDRINAGIHESPERQAALKTWSVVAYSCAGAAAVASAILFVARPGPLTTFTVEPDQDGFILQLKSFF